MLSATASKVLRSCSDRGFSSAKVRRLSSTCSMVDMPDRVTVTEGMDWRKRKAQAGTPSSGRSSFSRAAYSSGSLASLPPRRGSITQTGMFHSLSSSTLALAFWKFQSSQLS